MARVLPERAAMDLNHADGRTVAVLLATLVLPAAALLLVGLQYGTVERGAARLLHRGGGMNATPLPWLLTGMVLGAFTAAVVYVVRALQHAAVLPERGAVAAGAWRSWLLLLLVLAALAALLPAGCIPSVF